MVIENVQRRNTAVAGDAEQPIYLSDACITNLAVDVGIFCVQIVENLSLHQCSKKSIPALIIEAPFPVGPYLALLVFGEWLDLNPGSILRREIKQNRLGNCLFGKWEAYPWDALLRLIPSLVLTEDRPRLCFEGAARSCGSLGSGSRAMRSPKKRGPFHLVPVMA